MRTSKVFHLKIYIYYWLSMNLSQRRHLQSENFASHFYLKHSLRPYLSREKFKVLFEVLYFLRTYLFRQKAQYTTIVFRAMSQWPEGSGTLAQSQVERKWWELPFKGKLLPLFQLVRSLMEEIRFQKLFEWLKQENLTKWGLWNMPAVKCKLGENSWGVGAW